MTSDNLRWGLTIGLAGAIALAAVVFMGLCALRGIPIPAELVSIALLSAGVFPVLVNGMIGAKATQNGVSASADFGRALANGHSTAPAPPSQQGAF